LSKTRPEEGFLFRQASRQCGDDALPHFLSLTLSDALPHFLSLTFGFVSFSGGVTILRTGYTAVAPLLCQR
jgi:hypothetical protein